MTLRATFLLFSLFSQSALADCVVPQELWDHPRTAKSVLDSLKGCITSERITLVHGKKEEDILRSSELKAWLLSLGIDKDGIAEKEVQDDKEISIENTEKP